MSTINSTKDYSQFKFMAGNRNIDKTHVSRLKKEMLEGGNLMEVMPILVNENMFIIDGQHRFTAAQEIGMEIHYIVKDNANISTARHMNVTQKSWDIMDFARSFYEGGNKQYGEFIHMRQKFPSLSPSIVMMYMTGADINHAGDNFRRGGFMIGDIGEALDDLDKINQIRITTGMAVTQPMARAYLRLFRSDTDAAQNFDFNRLIKKLETTGGRALYHNGSTMKEALQTIETVYNFQSPVRTVLY